MPRKKISEFKAKEIVTTDLGLPFHGFQIQVPFDQKILKSLSAEKTYVLKVDQGVKGRMKKGLIFIDVKKEVLEEKIQELIAKGYSQFFIDDYISHKSNEERFLSLERSRGGILLYYSSQGGIEIENHSETIQKILLNPENIEKTSEDLSLPKHFLQNLLKSMDENHISFLEINPLIIKGEDIYLIDLAVEVDSAGEFFVKNKWSMDDFIETTKNLTDEEKHVHQLSKDSQASFSLHVLNKDGRFFLLMSGGGASLVLADELYNVGFGKNIGNYGEYSGNPNQEETYLYTKQILSLLLKSKAQNKILIIGGGIANFTDVRITFRGIVEALEVLKDDLKEQQIKIFVRRGGPYESEGLQSLQTFLEKEKIPNLVLKSDQMLTEVIKKALNSL